MGNSTNGSGTRFGLLLGEALLITALVLSFFILVSGFIAVTTGPEEAVAVQPEDSGEAVR